MLTAVILLALAVACLTWNSYQMYKTQKVMIDELTQHHELLEGVVANQTAMAPVVLAHSKWIHDEMNFAQGAEPATKPTLQ